jgi:glycine reductase
MILCYANLAADRVLPVDVLRELEAEGVIGKLNRYFYTTVGNGTSVANAKKLPRYRKELVEAKVDAVILIHYLRQPAHVAAQRW